MPNADAGAGMRRVGHYLVDAKPLREVLRSGVAWPLQRLVCFLTRARVEDRRSCDSCRTLKIAKIVVMSFMPPKWAASQLLLRFAHLSRRAGLPGNLSVPWFCLELSVKAATAPTDRQPCCLVVRR
jgi:hypothetical protein